MKGYVYPDRYNHHWRWHRLHDNPSDIGTIIKRDRHRRLYDVHNWSGIVLGLLIHIVAFSGTVAMPADESRGRKTRL